MKTSHLPRLRARGPRAPRARPGGAPRRHRGEEGEQGARGPTGRRPLVLFSLLVTLALAWGASAADRLVIWDKTEYIPFYNEFMAQFVQAWSEATGIEVEYTVVPPRDLITKLMTAVESGHVPDIATVEVGMVAQLAGMGATTITADLLAAIEAQPGDRFSEAAVRLVSIDGQPRGVPTATFPAALFYRNDLLEAAGVEPPQTIAAFREVARRTNNPRAGFIRNLFWANGGSVFAEDGRTVVVDSPQNVEVFQMLVEMYHQDKTIPPGALSWDAGGNNNAYMAGTAVMVFNSGSLRANMADMGHPLLAHTGVTLMPAGPQGRYNLGGGNTMVLFAGGNVAAPERWRWCGWPAEWRCRSRSSRASTGGCRPRGALTSGWSAPWW